MKQLYADYTKLIGSSQETIQFDQIHFKKHLLPHIPKEGPILDIGCGFGKHMKQLPSVTGIDISKTQIELGKKLFPEGDFILGDPLPFLKENKEVYGTILLIDVIEHLELNYAFQLIEAIYNSLKTGGTLLIQTPNNLAPFQPTFNGDITHVQCYSPLKMDQILRSFSKIRHLPLPPVIHGLKSLIRRTLWSALINPCIKAFMLTAYGTTMGSIYTANFLTIAKK